MKKIYFVILLCVSNSLLFAQVGIGNIDPQATLDISASNSAAPASTDGVLIPRISAFPVTPPGVTQNGMLVFLTTTVGSNTPGFYYWDHPNTTWKAVGGSATASSGHYVGELFGGGIVYYVYDNGTHGLIASLDDLDGGSGVAWSGNTSTLIGATAQSFYDGAGNTAAMVAQNATANRAGTLCSSYSNGGFSDWYLPANWELNLLYNSAYVISNILANDANGATQPLHPEYVAPTYGRYWSSTEYNSTFAWFFNFNVGLSSIFYKTGTYRVRAVRAF